MSVNTPKSEMGWESDFLEPVVIQLSHTIRRSTRNFMTHRISHMTSSYDSYFANFRSRGLSLPVLKIWIESLIRRIQCRCPFVSTLSESKVRKMVVISQKKNGLIPFYSKSKLLSCHSWYSTDGRYEGVIFGCEVANILDYDWRVYISWFVGIL